MRHTAILHAPGDGVGDAAARTVKVVGRDVLWKKGEESGSVVDDTCDECPLVERRALPLNEPVVIEFTPANAGDIAFACGMNMLHGTVVVQ